jgi:3-oxoisoapionate decarboxylase
MRLGLSSYTYTWAVGVPGFRPENPLHLEGLIRRAKEMEVSCLQVADNLALDAFDIDDLMAMSRFAQSMGVSIEIGSRGLTPQRLEKSLEVARIFNSPILRFVVDSKDYHPDKDECVRIIIDFLPCLRESKIKLALENHDRFPARTFLYMLEKIGSDDVGICLDSVNSMGCGEGIETVVEVLALFTLNLHVKDFVARRADHMMGFTIEGAPAGKGLLPLEWILERLSIYNRCQSAILELWTPPERELSETIRKEEAWARESISYLRKFFPDKE